MELDRTMGSPPTAFPCPVPSPSTSLSTPLEMFHLLIPNSLRFHLPECKKKKKSSSDAKNLCTKGRSFLPKPLREELPGSGQGWSFLARGRDELLDNMDFSSRTLQQGEWDLQAQASSNRQS